MGGGAACEMSKERTCRTAPRPNPSPQGGGGVRAAIRTIALALFALFAAACTQEHGPRANVILASDPATKLSDYGFFENAAATAPAPGVVPYDLVNALFSDHAAKHRYVYVPKGQSAAYDPDKAFDFPVGSVLIKT